MRNENVIIGGYYTARISGHITVVNVRQATQRYGRKQFECRNLVTQRNVVLSAAKLRRHLAMDLDRIEAYVRNFKALRDECK